MQVIPCFAYVFRVLRSSRFGTSHVDGSERFGETPFLRAELVFTSVVFPGRVKDVAGDVVR